jgi:hypothetical protein
MGGFIVLYIGWEEGGGEGRRSEDPEEQWCNSRSLGIAFSKPLFH